jgi:hypothetical protein
MALMMEAAKTSETLVNFYQTKRRYNPEDSHVHTHRRENFKSYLVTNKTVFSRIFIEYFLVCTSEPCIIAFCL